jgi:hypothetical protein
MDFGDFLWSLLVIYFIFFYFMILFRVIGDIFSDKEASGLKKTAWLIFLIFLPFLSLFIYLIVNGKEMTQRAMDQAIEADKAQQAYIRQVAGSGDDSTAQIARAHELLSSGAISEQEFSTLKAKALA